MTDPKSYLIIGAGVFGASTAYHLLKKDPTCRVTIIDREAYPAPSSASYDTNKCIRADYTDQFYLRLGVRAIKKWSEDELWSPYFHRSGMAYCGNEVAAAPLSATSAAHYQAWETAVANDKEGLLPNGHGCVMLKPHAFQEQFKGPTAKSAEDGFYRDMATGTMQDVFFNPNSGWAEAAQALAATVAECIRLGAEYIVADVERLLFQDDTDADGETRCTGVATATGEQYTASRVVLCTAAGTGVLLANSFPEQAAFRAGTRIRAAGIVTAIFQLSEAQYAAWRDQPVVSWTSGDEGGEAMPPLPADRTMKFNTHCTFWNSEAHPASDEVISRMPDGHAGERQGHGDQTRMMTDAVWRVIRACVGEVGDELQLKKWRFCWESITPQQDFLITPHPASPDTLYIATGGSFHGYKFLPVLGEQVLRMMEGTLDEEARRRWAWRSDEELRVDEQVMQGKGAHTTIFPRVELREMGRGGA